MLNEKGKAFDIVIEKYDRSNNIEITDNMLLDYLKEFNNLEFYAFILHDKDVNEVGELKRPHFHLFMHFTKSWSCNTVLMNIAKCLCINSSCISIRVAQDICKSIRYLTHFDSKSKYQYVFENVYTSDSETYTKVLRDCCYDKELSIDYLLDLVYKCRCKSDVFRELGIKNSRLYLNLVNELWKERG